MNRKDFCLEQRAKYPFTPQILSETPDYVITGEGIHIAKNVVFAPFGFGYEFINGENLLIPHIGKIVLEDNVYVHEGTIIVRGTVDETRIGEGTKIDTMVHIAHNVKIGKNCLIVSGAVLGGSAVIGDNCFLGIGCMIKNKVKIGDNVTVGMGAVVTKDIPDGETWVGNPAKRIETK